MLEVPMADELNVSPATMAESLRMVLSVLHLWMDPGCLCWRKMYRTLPFT